MMPGENGYRVSRRIRDGEASGGGRLKDVPIILLTARDLSTDPEREKMFLEFSGATRMVYKPFDIEQLVDRVRETLERATGSQERPTQSPPAGGPQAGRAGWFQRLRRA